MMEELQLRNLSPITADADEQARNGISGAAPTRNL
jgi:hypothetical protein